MSCLFLVAGRARVIPPLFWPTQRWREVNGNLFEFVSRLHFDEIFFFLNRTSAADASRPVIRTDRWIGLSTLFKHGHLDRETCLSRNVVMIRQLLFAHLYLLWRRGPRENSTVNICVIRRSKPDGTLPVCRELSHPSSLLSLPPPESRPFF